MNSKFPYENNNNNGMRCFDGIIKIVRKDGLHWPMRFHEIRPLPDAIEINGKIEWNFTEATITSSASSPFVLCVQSDYSA